VSAEDGTLRIDPLAEQKFALIVTWKGQNFDCGTYISRTAAQRAGKLFLDRKRGEETGRKKRPRGK
jgi:hypothetical protein